jgi:hypothetical protein
VNVLLIQIDGKLPNIALMRIAAHHRDRGDSVSFKWGRVHRELGEKSDVVYASAIFEKSRQRAATVAREYPGAIIGGTGIDTSTTLENIGITDIEQDYSIYPRFSPSIGFTQRGCRLRCPFCVVPAKEGAVRGEQSVWDLWRGEPHPRHLLLLDNDFFGQPAWRERIDEMKAGSFRVSFSQGINARMIGPEEAEAIASVDYRDDSMKIKRIYTAWDNRKDESRLLRGLELLTAAGVKPDHIMVYVLIGYWHRGELHADDFHRIETLLEFGARPYPMPFERTRELVGFQRWVVGAYAKKIPWEDWRRAKYQPCNLQLRREAERFPLFEPPAMKQKELLT